GTETDRVVHAHSVDTRLVPEVLHDPLTGIPCGLGKVPGQENLPRVGGRGCGHDLLPQLMTQSSPDGRGLTHTVEVEQVAPPASARDRATLTQPDQPATLPRLQARTGPKPVVQRAGHPEVPVELGCGQRL